MKQTAVEWLLEQIDDMYIHQIYSKQFEQAKEMEKQQQGYNQEKVFEIERVRAIDFAKWFADFNGLTRDEKRVTKEHLETLYEKYLQTLGGGLLKK